MVSHVMHDTSDGSRGVGTPRYSYSIYAMSELLVG